MKLKSRKLTPAQGRMVGAVAYLRMYMLTYSQKKEYEDYQDITLIDDVLYGLGVALGGKTGVDGYDEFKRVLRKHLEAK